MTGRTGPLLHCEGRWVLAAAALALGEACAFALRSYSFCALAVAVLALLTALAGYGLAVRGWPLVCLFLAGLAVAFGSLERRRTAYLALQARSAGPSFRDCLLVTRDGVRSVSSRGGESVVWYGAAQGVPIRIIGSLPAGAALPREGELWYVAGRLSLTRTGAMSPRGTLWCLGKTGWMAFAAPPSRGWEVRQRVRQALRARLKRDFPSRPRASALLRALLLGERLPAPDRQVFLRAGVLHVFAISGLHVVALAKGVSCLARAFFLPRRLSILATGPFLLLYMLAIDARASAWRAVLMTLFLEAGRLLRRQPSGFVAWSFAFFALHLACPFEIDDAGSTLSFTVMLALVACLRFLPACGLTKMSCVAWWAGTPVTARRFSHVSPGGLVLSPLAVPLASLTVVLAGAALFAGLFAPPLAQVLAAAAEMVLDVLCALSALVAAVPLATLNVEAWSRLRCFAWYACGLALVVLCLRSRARRYRRL